MSDSDHAKTKRSQQIKKNLYNMALLSFVVTVLWIGFEIFWSYTHQTPTTKTIKRKIEPLTANLYVDLAKTLSTRRTISQLELDSVKSAPLATPLTASLLLSEPKTSSPSAEVESSSSAITP
jgi:hypothetical protein